MHTCFVHVQQASIMHRNCCLLFVLQLSSLFISTIEIIWQFMVFGGICVNCKMWNKFPKYWALWKITFSFHEIVVFSQWKIIKCYYMDILQVCSWILWEDTFASEKPRFPFHCQWLQINSTVPCHCCSYNSQMNSKWICVPYIHTPPYLNYVVVCSSYDVWEGFSCIQCNADVSNFSAY